jgi:hypothetical protein
MDESITLAWIEYERLDDGGETFPARVSRALGLNARLANWVGSYRRGGAGTTTCCLLVRLCGWQGLAALPGLLELPATIRRYHEVWSGADDSSLSGWIADREAQVVHWNAYREPFGYSWWYLEHAGYAELSEAFV